MTTIFSFKADPPLDLIDYVVGIDSDSWLDTLRRGREVLRDNAQKSAELLLNPLEDGEFPQTHRLAVAAFVAGLHGDTAIYRLYLDLLERSEQGKELSPVIENLSRRGRTLGPYGAYPAGPLSGENLKGSEFEVSDVNVDRSLAQALEHAHFLTFHPRDASVQALERLKKAGWTDTGIVTLSQLISFLAFQIRVIHGLSVLRDVGPAAGATLSENPS
ncbi:CMD domain protein [Gluconobacter albidus]|uniref:CMD domain protein n=1 Tax=Gluconobacter albidus TaxID=318683 RepID=UPI00209EA50A|nr:CMD domain protein [Gluconobacter albidus]MCP1274662.1 CMD domain protein [Gluconobacter albidus]